MVFASTDPYLGEKAGGGTGGVLGFLLLGALIYFCCFKGKGKGLGGKFQGLPFGGRRNQAPGGGMAQDGASFPMNDPNFIPNQQYSEPPGQPGQQPPPYSPQYQPGAPNA
ncbi:uncharacterized protein LOC108682207 [Hyalella azteca]|uniref:Uncharacterized protein LOC108682207 n=1 Tax=Hyalella azteca TaxID=294128 RepID=A0A8B7PKW2_HYAAZ|nr:uncharacterized protein LOC108682207 [Hyalella azteca]